LDFKIRKTKRESKNNMSEAEMDEDADVFTELSENIKPVINNLKSSRRRHSSYVVEQVISYCPSLMKVEFVGQCSTKAHVRVVNQGRMQCQN